MEGASVSCSVCGKKPDRCRELLPWPELLRPPFPRREDFSTTGSVDGLFSISMCPHWEPALTYPDADMAALPFAFLERFGGAVEELSGSTLVRLARPVRGSGVSPVSLGCSVLISTAALFRLREVAGGGWDGGGIGWFGGFSLEVPAEGLADERVTLDDMRF